MKYDVERDTYRRDLLAIIAVAYVVTVCVFYLWKTLGEAPQMSFYIHILRGESRGSDLKAITESYRNFWNGSGGYGLPYPSFSAVIFYPLTILSDDTSYFVLSAVTIGVFASLLILGAHAAGLSFAYTAAGAVMAAVGIQSYGFIFELERGQFNVVAMGLALAGVFMCMKNRKFEIIGLVLLSLGAQLKIYPAILVFLLRNSFSSIRDLLGIFVRLVAINSVMVLVSGVGTTKAFIASAAQLAAREPVQSISMSAKSFTAYIQTLGVVVESRGTAIVLICLAVALLWGTTFLGQRAYGSILNPYKLMNAFCAALIIPSPSFDYKLPLLCFPMAYLWGYLFEETRTEANDGIGRILLFLMHLCFFGTTVSFVYRPDLFSNSFPFVFCMALASAILHSRRVTAHQSRVNLSL